MNILQLRCFLAVAGSLNFARAARQMHLSQPAVSHQIKTLEEELNVKLFRRSTRMVELTPEGLAFTEDARNIVTIADQAKLRFSHPDDYPIQELSIGCSNYAELFLLSDVLHELSASHPNLHPRLHVVPHEQLFHLLETGSTEVIFDIREGGKTREKLAFQELCLSSLICVCRIGYLPSFKETISLKELKDKKLIFCNPLTLSPDLARFQWQLAAEKKPADIHFCNSPETAALLAHAGFGIAILPELFLPPGGSIQVFRLAEAPSLSVGLFYHSNFENALLKEFIQSTRRYFSNLNASVSEKSRSPRK